MSVDYIVASYSTFLSCPSTAYIYIHYSPNINQSTLPSHSLCPLPPPVSTPFAPSRLPNPDPFSFTLSLLPSTTLFSLLPLPSPQRRSLLPSAAPFSPAPLPSPQLPSPQRRSLLPSATPFSPASIPSLLPRSLLPNPAFASRGRWRWVRRGGEVSGGDRRCQEGIGGVRRGLKVSGGDWRCREGGEERGGEAGEASDGRRWEGRHFLLRATIIPRQLRALLDRNNNKNNVDSI
ncbi:hypothetical protein H6P81_010093 [Aristolochia fimbriata]|uniref:Uncharacterized protein n=1 Tax=Aristolochia fimbriata TaxID=158543 RepID=A0AAV7EMR3_ARIFI|nr:hypothetical protein H6P81_010093 [Aristolochia fimbriata]